MAALNVRIPDELNNILVSSAKELERPKAYIVRKALKAYLQDLKEDTEDYNDAVEILKQNNPKTSWEEVKRECGLED
jgi:predicted DNA-binding protein